MIEAYIDKPEVTEWYVNAFKKFNINGVDVMKWHWSWWAFFGSVFYLLYRKSYVAAGTLFLLILVMSFIPLGWIILWILAGGYAPYFVYRTYQEKKVDTELKIADNETRLETMRLLGGTNEWAIWIGLVIHFFFWIGTLSMMGAIVALLAMVAASAS